MDDPYRDGPAGLILDGPLSFPFFPPALSDPLSGSGGGGSATVDQVVEEPARKPYLERVPLREVQSNRMVRFTEKLSDMVNALVMGGAVVRIGPDSWDVRPRRHIYTRAPSAGDDVRVPAFVGDFWIDTAAGTAYVCVANDFAAAVWLQIG